MVTVMVRYPIKAHGGAFYTVKLGPGVGKRSRRKRAVLKGKFVKALPFNRTLYDLEVNEKYLFKRPHPQFYGSNGQAYVDDYYLVVWFDDKLVKLSYKEAQAILLERLNHHADTTPTRPDADPG